MGGSLQRMGTIYLGAPGATDQQTRAKSLAQYATLNTTEEANDRCRTPDDSTAEDEHSDHNRTNFNPRQAPAWAPFTFQGLSYELRYAARRQPGRRGRRSRWPTPAGRGRRAGSEGPGGEAKSDVVVEVSRRQFFALFARAAHGAKNSKKCRGPCGPPAGVQPCASRSAGRVSGRRGGGVRHGIRRGRRGPPGMGAPRRRLQGRLRGLTATTSRRG